MMHCHFLVFHMLISFNHYLLFIFPLDFTMLYSFFLLHLVFQVKRLFHFSSAFQINLSFIYVEFIFLGSLQYIALFYHSFLFSFVDMVHSCSACFRSVCDTDLTACFLSSGLVRGNRSSRYCLEPSTE